MLLKELIAEYVAKNSMSYRSFAKVCGVSSAYLSMINSGVNPSTGKPPVVSYSKLKKIADGMGISMHHLFEIVDDMPVDIGIEQSSDDIDVSAKAMDIARAYDLMSDYGKSIIDFIVAQEEKRKRESFGKPKILSSGYKAVPMFQGKDDAELFMEYTAKRELMELSEEESPTAIKPDA